MSLYIMSITITKIKKSLPPHPKVPLPRPTTSSSSSSSSYMSSSSSSTKSQHTYVDIDMVRYEKDMHIILQDIKEAEDKSKMQKRDKAHGQYVRPLFLGSIYPKQIHTIQYNMVGSSCIEEGSVIFLQIRSGP